MSKRFRLALSVVVVVIVVAIGSWLFGREPSYEVKSLSDWVVAMRNHPNDVVARGAVHRLGTNSIPLLLTWLRREDQPSLRGRARVWRLSADIWLTKHGLGRMQSAIVYYDPKYSYRSLALLAFEELGPDGKGAIPELVQMLGDKSKPHGPAPAIGTREEISYTAGAAGLILSKMAPDAIPPLIAALSSPDEHVRRVAAGTLGSIGSEANAAIPVLKPWLHDSNPNSRLIAANVMGKLGGDPREFMPVVIDSLSSTDYYNLSFSLRILSDHKAEARVAVPLLLGIYTNTFGFTNQARTFIRQNIANTLVDIDPEAAAKAGAKGGFE